MPDSLRGTQRGLIHAGAQLPRCPSVGLQSRRAWKEAGTQGRDRTRHANDTACPVLPGLFICQLVTYMTTLCGGYYSDGTLDTEERLKDLPKVTDEAGVPRMLHIPSITCHVPHLTGSGVQSCQANPSNPQH